MQCRCKCTFESATIFLAGRKEKTRSSSAMDSSDCLACTKYLLRLLLDHHSVPVAVHLRITKTVKRPFSRLHWKSLRSDVEKSVWPCECRIHKSSNRTSARPLQPLHPSTQKWTHISTDFTTPLPRWALRNVGILTVVDKISKMAHFISFKPSLDAPKTAMLFKDHIYRFHGLSMDIISDRDPVFMSNFWKQMFEDFEAKLSLSSAYHP